MLSHGGEVLALAQAPDPTTGNSTSGQWPTSVRRGGAEPGGVLGQAGPHPQPYGRDGSLVRPRLSSLTVPLPRAMHGAATVCRLRSAVQPTPGWYDPLAAHAGTSSFHGQRPATYPESSGQPPRLWQAPVPPTSRLLDAQPPTAPGFGGLAQALSGWRHKSSPSSLVPCTDEADRRVITSACSSAAIFARAGSRRRGTVLPSSAPFRGCRVEAAGCPEHSGQPVDDGTERLLAIASLLGGIRIARQESGCWVVELGEPQAVCRGDHSAGASFAGLNPVGANAGRDHVVPVAHLHSRCGQPLVMDSRSMRFPSPWSPPRNSLPATSPAAGTDQPFLAARRRSSRCLGPRHPLVMPGQCDRSVPLA